MHTLLIDDDDKLGPLLKDFCSRYGIEIDVANKPSIGFEKLKKQQYDSIILDVMLPEMDGFEVCRTIRQTSQIPIIMLTARGEVTDRIVGLEIGADDYLPKPFEPRELVARLNRISKRRPTNDKQEALSFDNLEINTRLRQVKVNDTIVDLTTMEYQLLLLLAKSPGTDFSRDDILNALKGTDTELFSRSIDILVSRLRGKLKPLNVIKTVYGSGYAFTSQ